VLFHGADGDEEASGDLAVCVAARRERGDPSFRIAERMGVLLTALAAVLGFRDVVPAACPIA